MSICKTVPVSHKLPRASKRNWKKGRIQMCLDCEKTFKLKRHNLWSMDGAHTYYEWTEVIIKEDV